MAANSKVYVNQSYVGTNQIDLPVDILIDSLGGNDEIG